MKTLLKAVLKEKQPEPVDKKSKEYISAAIKRHATTCALDPRLVASIVMQESAGDPDAPRFEDHIYEKIKGKRAEELAGFVPKFPPSLTTEKILRASSFGLMQPLGETMRVDGFKERYLSKLYDVDVNLEWGCRHLRKLFEKVAAKALEKGESITRDEVLFRVLTRWNGSDEYPPKILAWLTSGGYKAIYFEEDGVTDERVR